MSGAGLGKLIAAQAACAHADHQQEAGSGGGRLQAGKVVKQPLPKPLKPAFGGYRIEGFFKPHPRARNQVGRRIYQRIYRSQRLQGLQLLPLVATLVAAGQMPIELVNVLIGELPVSRQHDPFMGNFTIHGVTSFQPR